MCPAVFAHMLFLPATRSAPAARVQVMSDRGSYVELQYSMGSDRKLSQLTEGKATAKNIRLSSLSQSFYTRP